MEKGAGSSEFFPNYVGKECTKYFDIYRFIVLLKALPDQYEEELNLSKPIALCSISSKKFELILIIMKADSQSSS